MVTIFAIKKFTGNPADGIDNVVYSIFSRIPKDKIVFLAEMANSIRERGAIARLKLNSCFQLFRYLEKIIRMRKVKPEYLFGNGTITDLPFVVFKPRKTAYIINWHTVLLRNEGYWKVRTPWWLRSLVFRMADAVIGVSEFAASSVKKYFPDKKVIAITNGVDSDFFNPLKRDRKYLSEKYNIDFSKPIVVFIGTLQPRKRPDLVIEIAKNYKNANFVFVGKDFAPPSGGLAFGRRIGNLPNGKWIPAMPREDIAVLLASSDAFIFPSLNEACAAVIVEAMASGIPSLVSDSGGNGEMARDGKDGFLIPPGANEEKLFEEKLSVILNNEALKNDLGNSARRRAEDVFKWEEVAARYSDFF